MSLGCFCPHHQTLDSRCFAYYSIETQERTDFTLKELLQWQTAGTIKGYFFKKVSEEKTTSSLEEKIKEINTALSAIRERHNEKINVLRIVSVIVTCFFFLSFSYAFLASSLCLFAAYRYNTSITCKLAFSSFFKGTLCFYCPYTLEKQLLTYSVEEHKKALTALRIEVIC
jgi:hypothetical protein